MAVLITGGYGHIGSWTAYYLAQAGERIFVLDTNPVAPDYLHEVAESITYIPGDVMDFPRLVDSVTRHRDAIDGIIHTVGIMGEMVLANPHHNVSLNIGGTLNMLEIARLFDIPKVVYTSTGAVYRPVSGVVTEDHPLQPSDLYGATKVSCEHLGQQYASAFGFEFRIARVYFCYGPGKIPSRFVRLHQMAFGALEGMQGLHMDRGADQRLDFTYIEDVGRGLTMLYQAENLPHAVYNIATGEPTSLNDVVALAQELSPYEVEVAMGPGVLMQRAEALDISRAQSELGFAPRYSLRDGLQRYAEWLAQATRKD